MHSVPFDSVSHVLCKYLAIQQFKMQPLSSRQFKFNLQVSFSNITLHKYNERNGTDEIYSKDNPLFYAFLSV